MPGGNAAQVHLYSRTKSCALISFKDGISADMSIF